MDPRFVFPTGAMAVASVPWSPNAMDALQLLVGVGMSDCSAPSLRRLSDEQGWTLAPLYRITGPGSYVSEPPSVTPILGNCFIALVFLIVHKAVSVAVGGGPITTMFPALTLVVAGTLLQGTTYYAVRHLAGTSVGTLWDAVPVIALLTLPGLVVCYTVLFHVLYFRPPQSQYEPYKASVVDTTFMQRVFLPRGYHTSVPDVSMYFPLFDTYIPEGHKTILVRYATQILVGVVTAIPATGDGCNAIVYTLTAIFVVSGLFTLVRVPTRVRWLAVTRGLTLLITGAITVSGHISESEVVISGLDTCVMVIVLWDTIAAAHSVWWDKYRSREARREVITMISNDLEIPMTDKSVHEQTKAARLMDFVL